MDVLEEYLKIEKLDPTQVPDSAVKHKEESFVKMTNEFSAVESSGKQFIKDATDVSVTFALHLFSLLCEFTFVSVLVVMAASRS